MTATGHALLVYLEPTPYILGLIEQLRRCSPWRLEVAFLGKDLSQDWKLQLPTGFRLATGSPIEALRAVLREIGDPQLRLLHLCGWGGHAALVPAMMKAAARGIPVVVESDTQAPFDEPVVRRVVKRLAYPLLFRLPKMFLPGGSRQRHYLRSYGVPDARSRIVQMTVDVEAIAGFARQFLAQHRLAWRAARQIDAGDVVFLFVGRLEEHKGIRELMAAFRQLDGDTPSSRLVIVGDGALRDEVRRRAVADPRIFAGGRLQGAELMQAYCSADVFVLPSEFEPWGLVVNEAMASGLPVIVSDRVGCADDLVGGRDTGLVYRPSGEAALAHAMRQLLTDHDARTRMGANAARLMSHWTLHDEASRIVSAWQAVT